MITGGKTIKSKLFIYFFILFAIFTGSILIFQEHREKQFKIAHLESRLREYTKVVDRFITHNSIKSTGNYYLLDSLKDLVHPEDIRITVIDLDGKVLYDNSVKDFASMENHLQRPEVQKAKYADEGYNIRQSVTTDQKYFYFARLYDDLLIRAAMVYDVEIRNFLKTERAFFIYLITLFLAFGLILNIIARRLGDSVSKLKDFIMKISRDEEIDLNIKYRNDELGTISQEITRMWDQKRKARKELALEKEKLISHLFVLKEGVAFFSSQKKVILNNSHFVFYTNIISEESSISVEKIFEIKAFEEMATFVDRILSSKTSFSVHDLPRLEFSIHRDSYHFLVQCIFFQDRSFEILITDNTQMVKRSIMKQQLTSNIAHELKTPISSAKGYLDTIRNNTDLQHDKIRYFVEKAFKQTERLSELVNDIALLNKIEESSELYAREKVEVKGVIHEVLESLSDTMKKSPVFIENLVEKNVIVHVNYSLLFSVFRNLLENSINYGGSDITVTISKYHEDTGYYYFSFADNGSGVDEEHLPRLFERFYRVDSGRSRKHGGTGLGLAIVKNAILSFKGEINVRKRQGGGLEFLFTLPK